MVPITGYTQMGSQLIAGARPCVASGPASAGREWKSFDDAATRLTDVPAMHRTRRPRSSP